MAGGILTFLIAGLLGAVAWLLLGSRFQFQQGETTNHWLNLGAYSLVVLPFAFVLVFFVVEAL